MNESMTRTTESDGNADGAETAAEAAETPTEASDAVDAPDAPAGQPDDVKWRSRYRAAETQLTVEQARVSEMNRREAQRLAAVHLADPADMWLDGCTPADLVGQDGLIDPDLVEDQAAKTIQAHPHWKRAAPVVGAPASAVNSDGKIPGRATQPTWAELLRGNNTG